MSGEIYAIKILGDEFPDNQAYVYEYLDKIIGIEIGGKSLYFDKEEFKRIIAEL